MTSRSRSWADVPAPARNLAFAAVFAVAVYLGRLTVLEGTTSLSIFWPAAGVAAAWFCLATDAWWKRAGLLAVVTVAVNATTGAGAVLCAGFVVTNVVQAEFFARFRTRWFPPGTGLGTRQLAGVLAATGAACALGTAGGVLTTAAAGADLTWTGAAVWFTRNAAGILLVTPVLLRLLARVPVRGSGTRFGRLELALALTASLVAYAGVFWGPQGVPLSFLPLAATIWLALRFDTTIVVVTGLVVATVTVLGTLAGHGPFATIDDHAVQALVVQVHVSFLAVLGLALAVGRDERAVLLTRLRAATATAEAERAEAERRGRFTDAVLASVGTGIVVADPAGRLLLFNDTARAWHGLDADTTLDPAEHAAAYRLFAADGTTPLDRAAVPLHRTLREGRLSGEEIVIARPGAAPVPVECSGRTVTDDRGTVLGAVVAMHDLTSVRSREEALARANTRLAAHARQVELLASASRSVLTAQDPRAAVCRAAVEIAGAQAAYLVQPDGAGHLVSTSAAGLPDGFVLDLDIAHDVSLTLDSFRSSAAVFAGDVPAHPHGRRELLGACEPFSGAWQPVVDADGGVMGVLAVLWTDRVEALDPTTATVLTGLAAEAAHAFARADLLAQLARAADHDALTGLVNRRRWDELASAEIARSTRGRTPLTFAILDLDHFKAFNDTLGHLAGDRLLREFAAAAGAQLREVDTLARWGGEEFALLLPGCGAEDARDVLDRIRAVVPQGQTCTVGVCEWRPGLSADDVIAAADLALYRGKEVRDTTVVGSVLGAEPVTSGGEPFSI